MLNSLKTLIVDESEESILDASEALASAGLEVHAVNSFAMEALVSASEVRPHIIMVALDEPLERPLSIMEELHLRHRTPIIGYTSEGTTELARRAIRAGARDLLLRPLTVASVEEAISTALSREELRTVGGALTADGHHTRGTVITIAGAKGGIGKSTLAVNLAIALRQVTGEHVALVDGDAQFGDIGSMLGLRVEHSIADLGRRGVEHIPAEIDHYLQSHRSGVDVLAAAGRSGIESYRYAFEVLDSLPADTYTVVAFGDLISQPRATVEKIYANFGWEITPLYSRFLDAQQERAPTRASTATRRASGRLGRRCMRSSRTSSSASGGSRSETVARSAPAPDRPADRVSRRLERQRPHMRSRSWTEAATPSSTCAPVTPGSTTARG